MSLVMLHLPVATRAVLAAGRGHRLVDGAWSVDPGYLLHALFARLFGNAAPKPFDIQESAGDMGETLPVLAYAAHDHRALATRASANGSDAVDWDRAGSKPMPAFAAGQALGFRVRVCPVLRVGKHHPRFAPGAEVLRWNGAT